LGERMGKKDNYTFVVTNPTKVSALVELFDLSFVPTLFNKWNSFVSLSRVVVSFALVGFIGVLFYLKVFLF